MLRPCTIERRSTKGVVACKACRGFPLVCVYNIGPDQIISLKMIVLKKIEVTTKFLNIRVWMSSLFSLVVNRFIKKK